MNLISKEELLKVIGYAGGNNVSDLTIEDNKLKLRQGNYEYIFNCDEINYKGSGEEFIIVSMADGWTAQGNPTVVNNTVTLDGASWLTHGAITLGGKDFQIVGTANESASDMVARRKIFELYTDGDLNLSLYSSGAGKNLDLLIHCGGTFDNYTEPAILEREYTFALAWKQATGTLTLKVDDQLIYTVTGAAFDTAKTFNQVLLGASAYHEGAAWKGSISNFKIYNGYAEA